METINEAKQHLRQNFDKGVECPCCGQLVKRYARLFDSGLARFLISLYQLSGGKTDIGVDKDLIRSHAGLDKLKATNYGIIRYWNLASPKNNTDSKKRTSGTWFITEAGIQVVEDRIKLPKYCYTYNNSKDGFSEERITIKQALGKHFNYSELMNKTHGNN